MAKYIYALINETESKDFGFTGIEEAEVYGISYQKVSAVVSETGHKEIDPTRNNILAHTIVQDKLLNEYTVLPMGFGFVVGDGFEVIRLMKDNYSGLVANLEQFEGKIEVCLKVFWNREAVSTQLEAENQFVRIKERLKAASTLEVQGLLLEAGRLVESVTQDWKARYARQIFDHLKTFSNDALMNEPLGIKNLLNASFLVNRSDRDTFKEEVWKLDERYGDRVGFKYIAPLPPYNFVNLKLAPVKQNDSQPGL